MINSICFRTLLAYVEYNKKNSNSNDLDNNNNNSISKNDGTNHGDMQSKFSIYLEYPKWYKQSYTILIITSLRF